MVVHFYEREQGKVFSAQHSTYTQEFFSDLSSSKRLVSKMDLSQLYKIKQKWENLKSGLDTGGGMVL